MDSSRFGDRYVLRLMPGEELKSTLTRFIEAEEIRGGYFIAFGAFERVRLQYFDLAAKQYRDNPVDRQVEVVSLMGNIACGEKGTMLHMHGAFGDSEARTYSGHIAEGIVRPTLEVFLTRLEGTVRRAKDPETGLDLLDLRHSAPNGRQTDEEEDEALAEAMRLGPEPGVYTP